MSLPWSVTVIQISTILRLLIVNRLLSRLKLKKTEREGEVEREVKNVESKERVLQQCGILFYTSRAL